MSPSPAQDTTWAATGQNDFSADDDTAKNDAAETSKKPRNIQTGQKKNTIIPTPTLIRPHQGIKSSSAD